MWPLFLNFCILKTLWVFFFVVFCITAFLLVMYSTQKDELRSILWDEELTESQIGRQIGRKESVDKKLELLAGNVLEKERSLKRSQCEVKNAEKILADMENKRLFSRGRYKSLMSDLKKDIYEKEAEVKNLQKHVSELTMRREALKHEIIEQQEDYEKMLLNFTNELETNATPFSAPQSLQKFYPLNG